MPRVHAGRRPPWLLLLLLLLLRLLLLALGGGRLGWLALAALTTAQGSIAVGVRSSGAAVLPGCRSKKDSIGQDWLARLLLLLGLVLLILLPLAWLLRRGLLLLGLGGGLLRILLLLRQVGAGRVREHGTAAVRKRAG